MSGRSLRAKIFTFKVDDCLIGVMVDECAGLQPLIRRGQYGGVQGVCGKL